MSAWDPPAPAPAVSPQPAPAATPMVAVTGVTKAFGDVVAVSDVTFAVGPGVTALLGPNGAGKSTLFRIMCGLTPPSQGTVRVMGVDARRDGEVRGRIGLAPQQDALFDRLSARRFVEIAAETHAVADPVAAADTALHHVELDPAERKPVGAYSKGMRQRVKLAAALVNDPDVLILDEPLTGLDPVQRNRMIRLFHDLGDAGKCLLVSSHVLDEVARLGSDVLVIAQGRLAAAGDYRALRNLMDDRPHRIRVVAERPRTLASALVDRSLVDGVSIGADQIVADTSDVDRSLVDGVSIGPDQIVADTSDVDAFGRAIAPLARELGVRLREVQPLDDDLESVFRYLVERR